MCYKLNKTKRKKNRSDKDTIFSSFCFVLFYLHTYLVWTFLLLLWILMFINEQQQQQKTIYKSQLSFPIVISICICVCVWMQQVWNSSIDNRKKCPKKNNYCRNAEKKHMRYVIKKFLFSLFVYSYQFTLVEKKLYHRYIDNLVNWLVTWMKKIIVTFSSLLDGWMNNNRYLMSCNFFSFEYDKMDSIDWTIVVDFDHDDDDDYRLINETICVRVCVFSHVDCDLYIYRDNEDLRIFFVVEVICPDLSVMMMMMILIHI